MKSKTSIVAWVVALVVIVLIIAGAWYIREHRTGEAASPAAATTAENPASASTAPQHPIASAASAPAPASTAPLPALDESDASVTSALTRLLGDDSVSRSLASSDIIQRVVATVDALPRREMGHNILPLKPPGSHFATAQVSGQLEVAPSNFERYATYMQWVRQADVPEWVAWYVHAYPLFQQAYRKLGYPDGYFNDRLVAVINHLLKAPEPQGPVAVVKTDKGYDFADPELENLSTGQKLMVRVGPGNEKILKQKLRAVRDAVTGQHGPVEAASASR